MYNICIKRDEIDMPITPRKMKKRLIYPIIVEEFNDEDGHFFVATSPNIPGMVTQGDTMADVAYWAEAQCLKTRKSIHNHKILPNGN